MNCSKCGTVNNEGSKFCIRCGNELTVPIVQAQINQVVEPLQQVGQTVNNYEPQHTVQSVQTSNISNEPLNYFMYIIAVLLKPMECFKEEENKLSNTKTALIFSVIVAVIMMLVNLLKTMVSAVLTKSLDYSTFKYKTSFEFSNLKDLDYLSLIGKNFIIYLSIIFAVALVYYLGTLIIKKNSNFMKMLSTAATSILPYIVLGMIISPLLGKIWTPLGVVANVGGIVYSLLIFFNLINKDLTFTNSDNRIYFNLSCLSILGVAGYYVYIKLLTSGITDQLSNLLDMFK